MEPMFASLALRSPMMSRFAAGNTLRCPLREAPSEPAPIFPFYSENHHPDFPRGKLAALQRHAGEELERR